MEAGGGWTVVGSTMSTVHKVESIAKKYRNGFLFFTENESALINCLATSTGSLAWEGGGQVFFVEIDRQIKKSVA